MSIAPITVALFLLLVAQLLGLVWRKEAEYVALVFAALLFLLSLLRVI